MTVVFPVPGLPIYFDFTLLDAAFFKFDPGVFEIRPSLAVPFSEMHNPEFLAASGCPFRAVMAMEKTRLNFQLPYAGNG